MSGSGWYTREGEGVFLVRVRAVPGAKKPGLAGVYGDRLKIRVSAPPEGGRANRAIAAVIAGAVGVGASDVEHVRGVTSRDKSFRVSGVDESALRALAG